MGFAPYKAVSLLSKVSTVALSLARLPPANDAGLLIRNAVYHNPNFRELRRGQSGTTTS